MKDRQAYRILLRLTILLLALSAFGCSSIQYLRPTDTAVKLEDKSLVLMKFVTDNDIAPSFEPEIWGMEIFNLDSGKKQKLLPDRSYYQTDDTNYCHHWLTAYLPAGNYMITRIWGGAYNLLVTGQFDFRTNIKFGVPTGVVLYAGGVQMTNRERDPDRNEPRSGPVLPLIDQAVTGFAKGTFEFVDISTPEDIKEYRYWYPALNRVDIQTGNLMIE